MTSLALIGVRSKRPCCKTSCLVMMKNGTEPHFSEAIMKGLGQHADRHAVHRQSRPPFVREPWHCGNYFTGNELRERNVFVAALHIQSDHLPAGVLQLLDVEAPPKRCVHCDNITSWAHYLPAVVPLALNS